MIRPPSTRELAHEHREQPPGVVVVLLQDQHRADAARHREEVGRLDALELIRGVDAEEERRATGEVRGGRRGGEQHAPGPVRHRDHDLGLRRGDAADDEHGPAVEQRFGRACRARRVGPGVPIEHLQPLRRRAPGLRVVERELYPALDGGAVDGSLPRFGNHDPDPEGWVAPAGGHQDRQRGGTPHHRIPPAASSTSQNSGAEGRDSRVERSPAVVNLRRTRRPFQPRAGRRAPSRATSRRVP